MTPGLTGAFAGLLFMAGPRPSRWRHWCGAARWVSSALGQCHQPEGGALGVSVTIHDRRGWVRVWRAVGPWLIASGP